MVQRLVVVSLLAACGGSSSYVPPAASAPAKFGDFYARVAKFSSGTTPVPKLGGTVTCWGGPARLNQTTTEIYLRHALDMEAKTVSEDLVTLSEGDLSRFLWRAPVTPGSLTLSPIEEVNRHFTGTVVVSGEPSEQTSTIFFEQEKWNTLYVTTEQVTGERMILISYGDARATANKLGIVIPRNSDQSVKVMEATVKAAGANQLGIVIRGDLSVIPPAKCDEMFRHFPPAHRVWPAPPGSPPDRAMFDDPITGALDKPSTD